MFYFVLRILLTVLASISLLFFTASISLAVQVLAFGDSITQGFQRTADRKIYGIKSPLHGTANIGGYLPALHSQLENCFGFSTLYNWGVAGETSTGGVMRIGSVLHSQQADYILIMFGANDLNAGISSSTTKANIRSMILQSREKNITPVVSELSPYNLHTKVIENDYNPQINDLAKEEHVAIVAMYQNMIQDWNDFPYHSGDGLHLSDGGYEVMANLWFKTMKKEEEKPSNIASVLYLLLFEHGDQ